MEPYKMVVYVNGQSEERSIACMDYLNVRHGWPLLSMPVLQSGERAVYDVQGRCHIVSDYIPFPYEEPY